MVGVRLVPNRVSIFGSVCKVLALPQFYLDVLLHLTKHAVALQDIVICHTVLVVYACLGDDLFSVGRVVEVLVPARLNRQVCRCRNCLICGRVEYSCLQGCRQVSDTRVQLVFEAEGKVEAK